MKIVADELLARIYHYYARDVGSMDPSYPMTPEKLRLIELCKSAGTGEPYERFRQMLRRLGARFPEFDIQNGSLHLAAGNFEACYSAKAWLPLSAPDVSHYYLGLLIGIIAPVYVVYRTIRHAPTERKQWSMAEEMQHIIQHKGEYPLEHSFSFTLQEQPYADAISAEIEATFGAERLTPEIGNIFVPDVYAGHRGFGKETIYTCLLSGEW